jgi:hypothetical protein
MESMQFGHALDRMLREILLANIKDGHVYLNKTYLSDGFYRVSLAPNDIPISLVQCFLHAVTRMSHSLPYPSSSQWDGKTVHQSFAPLQKLLQTLPTKDFPCLITNPSSIILMT